MLHDLFADHEDVALHGQFEEPTYLSYEGPDCHFDNIVIHQPFFVAGQPIASSFQRSFIIISAAETDSPSVGEIIVRSLRGPPCA